MAKKALDITGQRFGKLVALNRSTTDKTKWLFQCDCGRKKEIAKSNVTGGRASSCGCKLKENGKYNAKDLQGKNFGRLIAIERIGTSKKQLAIWKFQCECGNIIEREGSLVSTGLISSCGCLWDESQAARRKDLSGKRYGRLVVLSRIDNTDRSRWNCKCDCGNIKDVDQAKLINGETRSCGCLRAELNSQRSQLDIAGRVFGKLTAISIHSKDRLGNKWNCQCECGKTKVVGISSLNSGHTRSCGCLVIDAGKLRVKDLTGRAFGRLIALREAGRNKKKQARWECQCECGNKTIVDSSCLCARNGTKSCGCLNSGDDSIQALLNGNFRTPDETAFFYVFTLNRFPELTKPGIAKDIQRRADAEYGVMHDFIEGTRLEAWLIEQAILFETKHKLEVPEELEDWAGASELRRAGASEIFEMSVKLHELMRDFGMLEFTCRFLPTTPEQRIKLAEIL